MLSNTSFLGLRILCLDRFPLCFKVVGSGDTPVTVHDPKIQSGREQAESKADLANSTTHLTGLRGVAAVIVYNWHMLLPFYPQLLQPYTNSKNSALVQLPLLRFAFYGANAVYFFSCLSGYVQSLKPLSTDANTSYTQQCKQVARSTARRVALLLATTVPVTLISLLAVRLKLYRYADLGPEIPDFLCDMFPVRQSSLGAQFRDWLSFESLIVTSIWDFKLTPKSHYGTHLWTVPLDIRASLLLMPFLCCCNNLDTETKTLIAGLISASLRMLDPGFGAGFVCVMTYFGAVLASLTNWPVKEPSKSLNRFLRLVSGPLTLISLYVSSLPIASPESLARSGLRSWLVSTTPTLSLLLGIPLLSSIMILSPPDFVRQLLNKTSIQQFGEKSFSFYLIHQIFVHLIGYPAVKYLRDSQRWPVVPSVAVTALVLFPLISKAADLFDRHITVPLRNFIIKTI